MGSVLLLVFAVVLFFRIWMISIAKQIARRIASSGHIVVSGKVEDEDYIFFLLNPYEQLRVRVSVVAVPATAGNRWRAAQIGPGDLVEFRYNRELHPDQDPVHFGNHLNIGEILKAALFAA